MGYLVLTVETFLAVAVEMFFQVSDVNFLNWFSFGARCFVLDAFRADLCCRRF